MFQNTKPTQSNQRYFAKQSTLSIIVRKKVKSIIKTILWKPTWTIPLKESIAIKIGKVTPFISQSHSTKNNHSQNQP